MAKKVTAITRARPSAPSTDNLQAQLDAMFADLFAVADDMGLRAVLEGPHTKAWARASRKVIKEWRRRRQERSGQSSKAGAVSTQG